MPDQDSIRLPSEHARCVIALVRKDAEKRKIDAAYGGEYNDGGASQILRELEAFEAGLRGQIPSQWREFSVLVDREADPEYTEYERLRKKFE